MVVRAEPPCTSKISFSFAFNVTELEFWNIFKKWNDPQIFVVWFRCRVCIRMFSCFLIASSVVLRTSNSMARMACCSPPNQKQEQCFLKVSWKVIILERNLVPSYIMRLENAFVGSKVTLSQHGTFHQSLTVGFPSQAQENQYSLRIYVL